MDKFLFVLGSNWRLSIAELDTVLQNSKYLGRIVDYSANIAVVEFKSLHEEKYFVDDLMELQFLLGGCQKIAKIYDFIDISTINFAFPSKLEKYHQVETARNKILNVLNKVLDEIFPKIENEKLFFAVSIYPNFYDEEYYSKVLAKHFLQFLNKEIVVLLKKKGAKKSIYYMYPEKNIQSGNLNPIFPHVVIRYELLQANRAEIIFGFTEEGVYIARTFTVDDPNFKKKIDEEKPFKAHEFGISPKLSLIMLNFLNLFENRKDKKILDPFVGNGSIILLGLLQEFQIYGSDINENKVSNTLRNIRWLLRELEEPIPKLLKQRIRTIDIHQLSTFFQPDFFDGIITEPYLGPPFKEKPNYIQAKELVESALEPLYDVLFKEVYKILKKKGRICTISPIISTSEGKDVQLDLNKIAEKYEFKAIPMIDTNRIINKSNIKLQFPKHQKNLIDAKKGQILIRKIYIFEK